MRNICLYLTLLVGTTTVCNGDIHFRVTNYQPTKKQCGNSKGITASGHKFKYGLCAADTRYYPMGTVIKLDTGERLVVADTGKHVKGQNRIDRANPHKRVFPVTSRGTVLYWGNKKLSRYQAVKVGLQVKHKLKIEASKKQKSDKRGKPNVQHPILHAGQAARPTVTGFRAYITPIRTTNRLYRCLTPRTFADMLSECKPNNN